MKENPKPENLWCGEEYKLMCSYTYYWDVHEHTDKLENGGETEYCAHKNKFKKIKYKEVK